MNKFNRFIWHIRINTEWIKMGYMMTSNLFHSTHTQNCNFWRSQRWNLGMWTNTKQSKHMKYHLTNLDAINSCAIAYLVFCFFFCIRNLIILMAFWFDFIRRAGSPITNWKMDVQHKGEKKYFLSVFCCCCACLNKIIFFDLFHFW